MSYNGSGTFVINSTGQPVVTATVISSSTFNSLTADLGTGLSTAITKDGQTTTTAKIPFAQGISAAVASNFAAGTVGAPSIYLSTDTTTGLYRIGANNDGFAISGVKLLDLGSALVGITGALTVSTTLGVTGITTLGAALVGPASATVFNTVSTTVNAFGAATTLNIGSASTTAGTVYLPTVNASGPAFTLGGDTVAAPILTINGTAASSKQLKFSSAGTEKWNLYMAGTTHVLTLASAAVGPNVLEISQTTGIVTMGVYGAGAATFSAAGVISSVSDETWKTKDGIPTNPDAMLKKLEPGYWYYNDEKKETFGTDRQLGFYAQNVNSAIGPEAAPEPEIVITKNKDGTETSVTKPWGYYDRSVLAVTVMSLQKALTRLEALEAK